MTKVKLRSMLIRLCVLFIGVIISVVVLEVVLRIYNPIETRLRRDRVVLPINKEYVIENNRFKKLDQTIIQTKNSLGFRGDEPPVDYDKYLTIITVGGSTTEDRLLSDGKTWSARLQASLQEDFDRVWVNNAGFDGHSTFGHIVLVEDVISKLKPKIIIFLVGINDLYIHPGLNPSELSSIKGKVSLQSVQTFMKTMSAYSEVIAVALNLYHYYKRRTVGLVHAEINFKQHPQITMNQDKIRSHIQKHKEDQQQYKMRLKHLASICVENNIQPVFVTQPALYGDVIDDVTGIDLSKVSLHLNIDGKSTWNNLQIYNSTTKEFSHNNDFLVIDMANKIEKSSRYFYDFTRYTNEGASEVSRIMSDGLYTFLKEKYPHFLKP